MRSCRITRDLPAPKAVRTAISRVRPPRPCERETRYVHARDHEYEDHGTQEYAEPDGQNVPGEVQRLPDRQYGDPSPLAIPFPSRYWLDYLLLVRSPQEIQHGVTYFLSAVRY